MTVIVTAAVIEEGGRYFVTRRQSGVHLEGCWEFPGGKLEPGEGDEDGLKREMREELDVEIAVTGHLLTVTHEYPDRVVELRFYMCRLLGAPAPQLGQQMRWASRAELRALPFPPADEKLIRILTEKTDTERTRNEHGTNTETDTE
jgi:mutator protein MutT